MVGCPRWKRSNWKWRRKRGSSPAAGCKNACNNSPTRTAGFSPQDGRRLQKPERRARRGPNPAADGNAQEANIAPLIRTEAEAAQQRGPTKEDFTRTRDGGGLNDLLNYGYAVLLSTVLQKLFGVGLDPTWGISHAPRERATPLAYDLMEPFRPCVDWRVFQWVTQHPDPKDWTVTKEYRRWVTGFPLERVEYLEFTLEIQGVIEGVVRAIFVTRSQWERSFVLHGSPATEAEAEDLPEQIQLW